MEAAAERTTASTKPMPSIAWTARMASPRRRDVSLNAKARRMAGIPATLAQHCRITCSLKLARGRWPGQGNKLDDVLQRLRIPGTRGLHGALKDAHLLAQVIPHLR